LPTEASKAGGEILIILGGSPVEGLYTEHGIAAASTGGLRLCPHVYNTMAHVERAVAAVDALRAVIG